MGTSVAPFNFGGLAGISQLGGALANVQQTTKGRNSGPPILRLGRDGTWMFGPENIEPQPGSRWALNPGSIHHGYVAWVRNSDPDAKAEMRGEEMVHASQPKPDKANLPHYADAPWEEQLAAQLVCLNGEDEGTSVQYKPSSVGGREAFLKLIGQITKKAAAGDPAVVPVIELANSSYPHKRWGKTYVPVLNVIDWLTGLETDPNAKVDATQAAQAPAEPVQTGRRAAVGDTTSKAAPAPARKRKPVATAEAVADPKGEVSTGSSVVEQLRAAEAEDEQAEQPAAAPRRRRVAN